MTSDWLGGGLIVGLAAVLWLIYLVPTWFRRNEYNATERNVVRLQQTLRILAETAEAPEEVRAEASARSVVQHQRLLKKVTVNNTPPALRAAAKIRKARAVTSGILVLSLAVAVLGGVQTAVNGAWLVLVVGVVASTLCVTRLGRLAKDGRAIKLPAQAASTAAAEASGSLVDSSAFADERGEADFDDSEGDVGFDADVSAADTAESGWTPVPLPKPLYTERRRLRQLNVGQPLSSTFAPAASNSVGFAEQTASQAEQALLAAAQASEQVLRAGFAAEDARAVASADTEPVAAPPSIPSRFSTMGFVDDAETGSFDVDQVLARRRAG
ncbi:hypothetical protein [Subtercola lobariae]|uniref:Large exoprotein n=1 Tax=Subtercola lobariae TaxID=1588641 RepID=A0A917B4B8_9MICO|nr:hypothetical protein [Subtercola lobariae]GGF17817.1 hypothetical protein GCM10011399_09420 [Subtercola lobariae]